MVIQTCACPINGFSSRLAHGVKVIARIDNSKANQAGTHASMFDKATNSSGIPQCTWKILRPRPRLMRSERKARITTERGEVCSKSR